MKDTGSGFHIHVYSSGNNIAQTLTQTINGNVYYGQPSEQQVTYSDEEIAQAIEKCQEYFWGNSAYAVVFCIYRDDLKRVISKSDFETMVVNLPYTKKLSYNCPMGTIANAFSDNPIFNEHIDNWNQYNPMPRILKLRDQLRMELKTKR